ncbi:MAG TPA: hypothetical protein VMV52_08315 [Candidatus Nanopelagicaceae bacterium]|nr:hypothetical protein [Candidatus Nanopelagicaceae bacterium]
MSKFIAALLIAFLAPLTTGQLAIAEDSNSTGNSIMWQALSPGPPVWIVGSQISAYECVEKPRTRSTLAIQVGGGWTTVARGVAELDPNLCLTGTAPYAVKYQFTLDVDGQKDFPLPGTTAKRLIFRTAYSNSPVSRGIAAVYTSASELSADQVDGKSPGNTSNKHPDSPEPSSRPSIAAQSTILPKASATPVSSPSEQAKTRWTGCTFDGVRMMGRVKVVSAGAQFQIRLVGSKADLKVKGVKRVPRKCGEWQFVSARPTFTVEIVQSGEDFTVSLGANKPGLKK